MDEKELKTSMWQRIVIILVAIIMIGTMVVTYIFIVLGNGGGSSKKNASSIEELAAQYDAKEAELKEAAKPLSDKYLDGFSKYRSEAKSYNAVTANTSGMGIKDLKQGTGRTLGEDDKDYFAYYMGWCPDGSVFDSSFEFADDDEAKEKPIGLNPPLDPSIGLIEGWNQGVVGMKIEGVRQLTIPGELAYGESQEICGAKGSPLKFIIMAIEKDDNIVKLNDELNDIYLELYRAYSNEYAGSASSTTGTTDSTDNSGE